MATQPPPPPKPAPPTDTSREKPAHYVKIVQHSMLAYWWPVWLVGFILGAISFFSGSRMAVLPDDSIIHPPVLVSKGESSAKEAAKKEDVYKYTIEVPGKPPGDGLSSGVPIPITDAKSPFKPHMALNNKLGVIWAITLLMVIFITNVPLRGMWSVVIMVSVVLLSIIFFLAGIWEMIVDAISFLSIHINTGGYFFISTVLFVLWAVTVFLFDQQTYWIFTPGQLRIHEAIGGGEIAYDTRGMMTEKHRDDLFRHWILGLGTGDITVRTSGAQQKEFRIQNVWWVGHKLALIQRMQSEMQVVSAPK